MAWTSPRTWSSEVMSSTTLNTHLRDNLLHICSTTGNLTLTSTGPHALGTSVQSHVQFTVGGAFSGPGGSPTAGLQVLSVLSPAANQDCYLSMVFGTIVEASSGTHGLFASQYIAAPIITAGAGSVSSTASLYIAGSASAGTSSNYALLVAGGSVGFGSAGPHAIGGAADGNVQLKLLGTFSGANSTTHGLGINHTLNAVANNDAYSFSIAPTLVEAGSGTHNIFASAAINAPAITGGAAALSNAFTLFVGGAPTAATFNSITHLEGVGHDGVYLSLSDALDVAHGVTDLAPSSVFFLVRKASATAGGASIQGYTEDTGAFSLVGTATNVITTEAGGSRGNISLVAQVKSGTSVTTHAADDNIVVFLNSVNATHIFKGNGDSYEDGTGWTAFDDFEDVALIERLEYAITSLRGNPIKLAFTEWLAEHRAQLQQLRLASFDDLTGKVYVNRSGIQALLCGFARQCWARVMSLEARVTALEAARG